MILLSVAVYSFFSYPFSYPFTYLAMSFSLIAIFTSSGKAVLLRKLVPCLLIISDIVFAHKSFSFVLRFHDLREWRQASQYEVPKDAICRYDALYDQLRYNYRFLYDYACKAFDSGQFKKALTISKEAATKVSDYNLTLLMADSYKALSETKEAIALYYHAHNMCPSRIVPYYEIYKIYSSLNDTLNCRRIYQKVECTPIKVNNYQIDIMLKEIKSDIQRF